MNKNFSTHKQMYLRLTACILIWQIYIQFMSVYAPLGTEWLSWHSQRIYNFSEYLNLNGYFSSYGFSIWSTCQDCSLKSELWTNKIYLSSGFFSYLPYLIINNYFGGDSLKIYGPLFDKTIIFFTGFLIAELLIKLSKNKFSSINLFVKSVLCFTLFIVSPWTYKMLINSWMNIFFLLFFLIGIFMFINKKINLGLLFFFIAGLSDYQSSAGLAFFYFSLVILFYYKKKQSLRKNYFPTLKNDKLLDYKVICSLALPVLIYFSRLLIAGNEIEINNGPELLTRMGISGNDIHNGSLLGALQFLGGNRITQCLTDFDIKIDLMNFSKSIYVYNCILSTLSMFFVSLVSIIGLFFLNKSDDVFFKLIIFPISFLFLSYTFILQQSSSVHLMGYSYFFSVLFSVGITAVIFKILEKYNFSLISIFLITPISLGIILLCIRVSMLTGING